MAYGVQFSTKYISDEEVCKIFIDFANNTKNYTYREKFDREYTAAMQAPSCFIGYENSKGCVGYAITKRGGKYSLVNIVPRESGFIPSDIASEYAKTFVCDLRKFLKTHSYHNIKISLSKRKRIRLEDIIPGKKTRHYFETYLNGYPLTHHPADIQRLDIFICAAHRYSHKAIDIDLIYTYLCNILKWPEEESKWCCNRIEIGLKILKVNKKF